MIKKSDDMKDKQAYWQILILILINAPKFLIFVSGTYSLYAKSSPMLFDVIFQAAKKVLYVNWQKMSNLNIVYLNIVYAI